MAIGVGRAISYRRLPRPELLGSAQDVTITLDIWYIDAAPHRRA